MKNFYILLILLFSVFEINAQSFPDFTDTSNSNSNLGIYYYNFVMDSTYVVVGDSFNGLYFAEYDFSGNFIRSKHTGVQSGLDCYRYDERVLKLSDKFIVASAEYGQNHVTTAIIVAVDFNFDTLWVWRYPVSLFFPAALVHTFTDIVQTPDGGFIVAGYISGNNLQDPHLPYLMKISPTGQKQWHKYFQIGGEIDNLILTPDLGILFYYTIGGGKIVKTNALGVVQWQTPVSGRINHKDAYDMIYTGGQTYMLARAQNYVNTTDPYSFRFGVNIVKFNHLTGQILVDTFYIPAISISRNGGGIKLHLLSNNNIMITTSGLSNINNNGAYGFETCERAIMFYVGPNGDSLKTKTFITGYAHRDLYLSDMVFTPDGGLLGCGSISMYGSGWSKAFTILFKTGGTGFVISYPEQPIVAANVHTYPNPANDIITFEIPSQSNRNGVLEIFNSNGKIVLSRNVKSGIKSFKIDLTDFAKGIYFYNLSYGDNRKSGKFVVE